MAKATVEYFNGAPTIMLDGKPFPPMSFTIARYGKCGKRLVNTEYYKRLGESGIRLYFVCSDTEWTVKGGFDLCKQEIEAILSVNPDAYFILRVGIHPPVEWATANPDEMVQFSDGLPRPTPLYTESFYAEYPGVYSLCSDKWREDAGEALKEMYRQVKSEAFGERVIGFFFSAGGTSEWYYRTPMTYTEKTRYADTGGFDHVANKDFYAYGDLSPAFRREFSRYLKAKYGTVEALRLAWDDESASFEEPRIPGIEERYFVDGVDYDLDHMRMAPYGTDKLPLPDNGTHIGHFIDLKKHMDVFDFYRALHLGTANSVVYFGSVIKEISGGEMLTGAFYGAAGSIHFFDYSQLGGVQRILESGMIDFLSSPGVYENRSPGGFTGERQLTDSINLHGRILFVEDDERTHKEGAQLRNYFEVFTMEDTANILKRTLGRNLAQNTYGWWFDQHQGGGRYLDDGIYALFDKQQAIIKDYYESCERKKNSEIAVIYDEESYHVISEECNHQNVELFRNYEIDRIGAPCDRYLHNDLSDPRMPDYKLYIFMNTLYLSTKEREAIKRKLKKNGATALFMYGSGVINPDKDEPFSVDNMSELIGMTVRQNNDAVSGKFKFVAPSEYTEGLDPYEIQGDFKRKMWANTSTYMNREKNSRVILYPEFYTEDEGARVVARLAETNHPALSIKECDGYTSIYSATRYLDAKVVKAIARAAGVHIYVDTDEVLYACEGFVTVHASSTGKKVIRLPRAASAYEVYEEKYYSRSSTEIVCDMKLGETKTFRIS